MMPSEEPQPRGPSRAPREPSLRPTSLATLSVAALSTAAVAWLGISHFYGDLPPMKWLPPLTLAGLALVEAVTAMSTQARIDRRAGTQPINPLVVARYVVLAKASSLAGALFAGGYGGFVVWLITVRGRSPAVNDDLAKTAVGLAGSVALVVGGLWLERACRVPPQPENGARPPVG